MMMMILNSRFAMLLQQLLLLITFLTIMSVDSRMYPEYYVVFKNIYVAPGECIESTTAITDYLYLIYVNELLRKTLLTDTEVVQIDPLLANDTAFVATHPQVVVRNRRFRDRSRRRNRHLRLGTVSNNDVDNNDHHHHHTSSRLLPSQCQTFCNKPKFFAVHIRLRGCDCNRRSSFRGTDDDDGGDGGIVDYYGDGDDERLLQQNSTTLVDPNTTATAAPPVELLYQTGNSSYIAPGPAFRVASEWYSFVLNNITTVGDCRNKMYNTTYEVWEYYTI